MSGIQTGALFALSILAFIASLALHGVTPSWSWLTFTGLASTVVTAVVAFFVSSAWKWPWLYGWFVHRPDLSGEWNVRIESNFVPEGSSQSTTVEGKFRIVQTFTRLLVCFYSAESTGDPIAASLETDEAGQVRLAGVFRNDVEFKAREKMAGHFGAYLLKVEIGHHPRKMTGTYWNDRGNAGMIEASRV